MQRYLWIVAGILGLAGAGLIAQADEAHLNVKLGLWEVHTIPTVSGDMPSLPEDQLAKLTPEQRARLQAAMGEMNKPRTMQECMTAQRLKRGFNSSSEDASCKITVITNSSSEFESKQLCSSPQGSRNMTLHLNAESPDHIVGIVSGAINHGGKAMNYSGTMEGKWLGSDCGSVKDFEMEK